MTDPTPWGVIIHPDFWHRRRLVIPGGDVLELPTTSRGALEGAGFQIVEHRQPSFLFDGSVLITGEVDRTTGYEPGFLIQQAWHEGAWQPDPLVLDGAKAGDNPKFEENDRKWTANAEELATLLSNANPNNWPKADVTDLLMQHLNLTKGEVVARLHGNWEADVEAFDQIFTEILTVSDVLADGIVKQFPEKF